MNDQQILAEFYKLRPDVDVDCNDNTLIDAATPVSISSLSAAATRLEMSYYLLPRTKALGMSMRFSIPTVTV